MPSKGANRRTTDRTLARIERKAQARALQVAEFIVRRIEDLAPRDPQHERHTGGERLAESYHIRRDPTTGDFLIWSSQPYWVFVEFGTIAHGGPGRTDAQPHVRPAIDIARAKYR